MLKVYIIQPSIPHYRRSFFENLSSEFSRYGFSLHVDAARNDNGGNESITEANFSFDNCLDIIDILGGKLIYMKGIDFSYIEDCDVIVVCGNPRIVTNFSILFFCKLKRKKIIWWGQGWSAKTSKFSYFVRRLIMKLFDGVVLYTHVEKHDMLKKIIRPKLIGFTDNGLDYELISEYRNVSVKKANGNLRLLFIGRLTEKSGVDLIFKSISQLSFKSKVELHIIGGGELKDRFQKLSSFYDIENAIFYGEILDEEKISEVANLSHFFIYGGSVGLSIIHAMSYGLPCIIHSDIRKHMPEAVVFTDYENGISFDCGCEKSLAIAVSQAYKIYRNEQYFYMSENAIRSVSNRFTTKNMAKNFVKLIKSTVDD